MSRGTPMEAPGRQETRFEEQVRRKPEQQLAYDIGGREESR